MRMTLDDLLAPISPESFFAEYYDRKPLHVPGGAAKFAQVLSWRQINRLLDMSHIWTDHSLKLVLDSGPRFTLRTVVPRRTSVPASTAACNTTSCIAG